MAENKPNTRPEELEVGTAKDVEEMMKKYDRESNVRIWTGVPRKVIRYLCAAFSLYCIWVTLFSTMMPEEKLNLFLGLILVLGYLNYPISKKHVRPNYIPWYDIVILVLGALPFFYCALNAHSIIKLAARVTRDPKMVVMAVVAILAYMELCRRCVGIPILCVVGILLVYAFANVRFGKVIYDLFYTTTGIMSTPINVCAKYIVVFIIFGAFLERTGISNFFINLANSIAGASSGGPAKVAVISSALCGMVSGSSVGNTVTTGSVTIPMMKKTGYRPEFAGAVEAAASTGGQIMPPVMGSAAFLISETCNVPYRQLMIIALIPAVLYFTGIWISVHLEAKRLGLKGLPREKLPKLLPLMRDKGHLLLPLVGIIWLMLSGYTINRAALLGCLICIIVPYLRKGTRVPFLQIFTALPQAARSVISVATACSTAGIIIGMVTLTGLGQRIGMGIFDLVGNSVFLALVCAMFTSLILGMGVSTTSNYLITSTIAAPILIKAGIPLLASHMFCFYFGIVADITPPVALAAYAGSAIAKGNAFKTGVNATKLAIAAFLIPYMFALNPKMIMIGGTFLEALPMILTAVFGLIGIGGGFIGYLNGPLSMPLRLLCFAGGLCMVIPGTLTDIIGAAVVLGVILLTHFMGKTKAAA